MLGCQIDGKSFKTNVISFPPSFSALNLPLAVESGSRKIKNSRNPDESDIAVRPCLP
jgi:hypothetical protein